MCPSHRRGEPEGPRVGRCQPPWRHPEPTSTDPEKGEAGYEGERPNRKRLCLEGSNGVFSGNKTVLLLLKLGISSVVVGTPIPTGSE